MFLAFASKNICLKNIVWTSEEEDTQNKRGVCQGCNILQWSWTNIILQVEGIKDLYGKWDRFDKETKLFCEQSVVFKNWTHQS